MIEARDLSRRYGDFEAVSDVSFSVDEGEIVGLLGPNGAGKTTTIRMVTGFLPPTSGRVTVAGRDLFDGGPMARRELGYLPENVNLYPEMRVEEYLAYRARLERMDRSAERRAIPEVLERCLLTDVRRQILGTLSKGYRQRVGLAVAILHQPQVLVLDEPTVGLDPKQIIAIRELIRELGRERTLLLSTHILPEVELLCDRLVILDRGRVVAQGTPDELRRRGRTERTVRLELADPAPDVDAVLIGLPAVTRVEPGARRGLWRIVCAEDADPRRDVFEAAVARGWTVLTLALEEPTLEEMFVRLTTRDVVDDEPVPEPVPETAENEEVPS